MRQIGLVTALATLALLAACGQKSELDALSHRTITLPNGQVIKAEVMTHQTDMMRGMMFRDSLAPDRGMLFVHGEPGPYTYWMHQVRIPLDMIWLDPQRTIVEIVPNAQPCPPGSKQCPGYGGHARALFVLELAGGMAQKYGLKVGDSLRF